MTGEDLFVLAEWIRHFRNLSQDAIPERLAEAHREVVANLQSYEIHPDLADNLAARMESATQAFAAALAESGKRAAVLIELAEEIAEKIEETH